MANPNPNPNPQDCLRAFPRHRQYDVIVMDPPWDYCRSKSSRYKGVCAYPGMSVQALSELPVPGIAAKDCAMLMWCTGPQLPHAFTLFSAWEFKYKTVFLVWRKVYASGKPRMGLGWYTRPCCEYLLLAVKGSVLHFRQHRNLGQALDTEIEGHSVKPVESYARIEAFFGPSVRKLEMFARKPRPGWDTWGLDNIPYYRCGGVGQLRVPAKLVLKRTTTKVLKRNKVVLKAVAH